MNVGKDLQIYLNRCELAFSVDSLVANTKRVTFGSMIDEKRLIPKAGLSLLRKFQLLIMFDSPRSADQPT